MIQISLLCLILLTGMEGSQTYSDLVALNADQYGVLELKERIKISVFDVVSGSPQQLYSDEIAVAGNLIQVFDSPSGPFEGPSYILVGASKTELYFMKMGKWLEVFNRSRRTWTSIPSRHPENIGHIWPRAEGYLAASELVTRSGSNACDRSYFALCSADGAVLSCSGEGKPFLASFTAGDFPTSYQLEQQNSYGIYYRKSGELLQFGQIPQRAKIDRSALLASGKGPGKENVFGLNASLILTQITETAAAVFVLEKDQWKLLESRKGVYQKAVAVKGWFILLDQLATLEAIPIKVS